MARQTSIIGTSTATTLSRGNVPSYLSAAGADVEIIGRIQLLKEELAVVTAACSAANQQGEPGRLFFLLRKKWQLMQRLFEAENQLQLLR